jgi:hypothetical protein
MVAHASYGRPPSPRLASFGTVESDQKTIEGAWLLTEVVGVHRSRRGKHVLYREYLFDPSETEVLWAPPTPQAA